MFLGAVNQTIIVPAMPRIVAGAGGMERYSWIVVSTLLSSDLAVLEWIGMAASAALVLYLAEAAQHNPLPGVERSPPQ